MITRDKALLKLMSKRKWYEGTEITEDKATNYKNYLKNGKLSIEKQREILIACGYKIAQEELWLPAKEKK